jgi:hypothetical protein
MTPQWRRDGASTSPATMSFADSVDAIIAATNDGKRAGHDLPGFTRRTRDFGYRFVARWHRCGHEIIVHHRSDGWEYGPLPRANSSGDQ